MGEKIRGHIRSNVVGYVALFFALSGGAAWATHPGGANTISSGDIINGEVRSADIGSANVQNSDIGGSAVTGGKIAPGTVQGSDVQNDDLTGTDIADTSSLGSPEIGGLGSADVTDGSLTGDDIANRQRAINIPLGSFINCSNPAQIGFSSGNDNDPDFVTQGANRLQVAWDVTAGTDTTPDTDAICTSVMVPPDIGGNAPVVRLLSIAGSAHNNDWVVTGVQQRDGAAEQAASSTGASIDCDKFDTTGNAYVCSHTLSLVQPGEVQPNDVFTLGIARGGGSNEMRLYGVQLEYTSQQ